MTVIIIGAGRIGLYCAALLSAQNYHVILIDSRHDKIDALKEDYDIQFICDDIRNWDLLQSLVQSEPQLLFCATENDELNITTCHLAKKLGYPKTIARVKKHTYFKEDIFDIIAPHKDHGVASPERLTAHDLYNFILHQNTLFTEHFFNSKIDLCTIKIPTNWQHIGIPIKDISIPKGIRICLIKRAHPSQEISFPSGNDIMYADDEVSFVAEHDCVKDGYIFFDHLDNNIKSIILLGLGNISEHLSRLLEPTGYDVQIIDRNYENCNVYSKRLPHTSILHHEGFTPNFLEAHGVGKSSVFIASTRHDETNITACLMAQSLGCEKTALVCRNDAMLPLIDELDITTYASPQINIANKILKALAGKRVLNAVSIYQNQAEILDVTLTKNCGLIEQTVEECKQLLPKGCYLIARKRRSKVTIISGKTKLAKGDRVLLVANPNTLDQIKQVFQ